MRSVYQDHRNRGQIRGSEIRGIEREAVGHLGGSMVEHLPLAQVMILGSWD